MTAVSRYLVPPGAICLSVDAAAPAIGQEPFRSNPERMEARITALSEFGANPEGGVTRVAFSDADLTRREYIMKIIRSAGLDVRVDTAGNVIGRREGRNDRLPPILFGLHIDSVAGSENYDGGIGAIEVVELLDEHGIETRHPLRSSASPTRKPALPAAGRWPANLRRQPSRSSRTAT